MAAGEDETEAIVLYFRTIPSGGIDAAALFEHGTGDRTVKPGLAAQYVDGFESSGGNEPGARVGGHTFAWPLFESGGKGGLQGLFGQIEIAEKADQRGEDAAGFGAIHRVDLRIDGIAGQFAH